MNVIKQQKLDQDLRAAISMGNIHAVKLALASGANPAMLADNPFVPGEQRLPAFFWGVMSGNLAMVKKLLELGFEPSDLDASGQNALFHVPPGPQGMEMWDFLLSIGLDPEQPSNSGAVAWKNCPHPSKEEEGPTRTWRAPKLTLGPTRRGEDEDED
jgi:ankyrin repeat protein